MGRIVRFSMFNHNRHLLLHLRPNLRPRERARKVVIGRRIGRRVVMERNPVHLVVPALLVRGGIYAMHFRLVIASLTRILVNTSIARGVARRFFNCCLERLPSLKVKANRIKNLKVVAGRIREVDPTAGRVGMARPREVDLHRLTANSVCADMLPRVKNARL